MTCSATGRWSSSAATSAADGLAAELTTPEQRRRYIATFYTSRLWAHPGAFTPRRSCSPAVGPFLLRDCGHFVPWEAAHQLTSGTVAFCSDLLACR